MSVSRSSVTVLAHLLRPQGRRGELLAELLTDFPERFTERKDLHLAPPGFHGELTEARPVHVVTSWLPVGKNRGRIVLALEGIGSITEAEALTGLDVVVPEDGRILLPEDSSYVSDLTGCFVFDGQILVGEVVGVDFPASSDGARLDDVPALLEVRSSDGSEVLIPFVKAFLKSIDLPGKKIVFELPDGLVDVNR